MSIYLGALERDLADCTTVADLVALREEWEADRPPDETGGGVTWIRRLCALDPSEVVRAASEVVDRLRGKVEPALRGYLDDAALYALAILWWDRASRSGKVEADAITTARDLWVSRAIGQGYDWWPPRLAAAAWILEGLGIPRAIARARCSCHNDYKPRGSERTPPRKSTPTPQPSTTDTYAAMQRKPSLPPSPATPSVILVDFEQADKPGVYVAEIAGEIYELRTSCLSDWDLYLRGKRVAGDHAEYDTWGVASLHRSIARLVRDKLRTDALVSVNVKRPAR